MGDNVAGVCWAQTSNKLKQTQEKHARAQASGSQDMKASLPLATINELGQVTSPVWLLRQKGFDFGSVVTYPRADAIENEAVDPEANEKDRCSYMITNMDPAQ